MLKAELSDSNKKRLKKLSIFLCELRLAQGLTQTEAGEAMNLHRNSVLRAEHANNITLFTIFKYADEFDIPISQLFQDID